MMDEHLVVEFNEWARAGRGESMEKGHGPVGQEAIERMRITPDSQVLDVGCGSGWATRLLAQKAFNGYVVGIDISDAMIDVAIESSSSFSNVEFKVATAEHLPFHDDEFTHAFSMESLYYYSNMLVALREVHRALVPGGLFVCVIDLYLENTPSHQWVDQLKVPVHLLGIPDYREMFEQIGFVNVKDERVYDQTPVPENYSGSSFKTREDYVQYKANGSLMLSGEAGK